MSAMRPVEDEDEEDLSGPVEADPEAEGAAIDMLLVGPSKEEPGETDPQVLMDDIETAMAQLRKLLARTA
jgi:hypothetical protein